MNQRLDRALSVRGLARSRTLAAAWIREGRVSVNGSVCTKASTPVSDTDRVSVAATATADYVSRAGHKLAGALDTFTEIDPRGLRCLDAGASTGGFTDVLLRRGAREVLAVDVGHGQLVAELRTDPRVRVYEGLNVRYLDPRVLPGPAGLTVCDLSFISLTHVLRPLAAATAAGGDLLFMVKPQFEVGAHNISRTGVVTSPTARAQAVDTVSDAARRTGLHLLGSARSPLPGQDGNVEFFVWCRKPGAVRAAERLA